MFEIDVNEVGNANVHYHECDIEESENDLTVGDLGTISLEKMRLSSQR